MRTDPKQSDENREEAGLEEALKLWMEIRQVDRKKGWERLEAEIGRQHVQLMPGQQASLGRQGGEIVVGEVNIQQVVDWKNGMFVFDDLSLEAILRKVARWYDVEVFYRNQQAKAIVFKGNLPRYGELPELLKVLENSSEVHFSLKGNALIVE